MTADGGHLITLFVIYICKYFIIRYLEARGVEPLFSFSGLPHEVLFGCKTSKDWVRAGADVSAFGAKVAPACRISPSVILLKAAGLFGTESKLSGKEGQVVSLGGIKRRGRFLDRVIHDAP